MDKLFFKLNDDVMFTMHVKVSLTSLIPLQNATNGFPDGRMEGRSTYIFTLKIVCCDRRVSKEML